MSHNDPFQTSLCVFCGGAKMTSLLKFKVSDITFNVACELSQPMGKTEFSRIAKNRTNSFSLGKKKCFKMGSTLEILKD